MGGSDPETIYPNQNLKNPAEEFQPMPDYSQQIKQLEEELKKTKYNKATQGHIGLVKAKMALLREKQESRVQKKTGK